MIYKGILISYFYFLVVCRPCYANLSSLYTTSSPGHVTNTNEATFCDVEDITRRVKPSSNISVHQCNINKKYITISNECKQALVVLIISWVPHPLWNVAVAWDIFGLPYPSTLMVTFARGLDYQEISMLKTILGNRNIHTWLLIGWQHNHQTQKSGHGYHQSRFTIIQFPVGYVSSPQKLHWYAHEHILKSESNIVKSYITSIMSLPTSLSTAFNFRQFPHKFLFIPWAVSGSLNQLVSQMHGNEPCPECN